MDWKAIALRIPDAITLGVKVAKHFNVPGKDKKQAVLDSLPEAISGAELAVGKDFLNDPAILELVGAVIDAERAVQKARAALQTGLLAKQGSGVPEGVIVPPADH